MRMAKKIGVAFLVIVGLLVLARMRQVTGPVEGREALLFDVDQTAVQVQVLNRNTQAWRDAALILNDRFTCPLGRVEPGATVIVPIGDCVTDGGVRFAPELAITKAQLRAMRGTQTTPGFKTVRP